MRFGQIPWFATILGTLAIAYLASTAPQRADQIIKSRDFFAPPPLSQLDSKLIQVATLGHKHVYESFINIWLLQILLDEQKPDQPERMMETIRSVLRHLPKYETLYMLSCYIMIQDFDRPDACQEIILKGLDAFPQSWRLPVQQGYVHAFLRSEPAQAASFFSLAASRPNSPEWVESLAQKLLETEDITQEDLQRSLSILEHSSVDSSFLGILRQLRNLSTQSRP